MVASVEGMTAVIEDEEDEYNPPPAINVLFLESPASLIAPADKCSILGRIARELPC